ncbi:MAG: methylated-DNA--[protein]-cysteine S-methyltransferase, partial [Candidatus Rokuibacteriota bacterium]
MRILLGRFRIEATDRGVRRLRYGPGADRATAAGRRHAARARRELAEYLAGRRAVFSVALDLAGLPPFQAKVLSQAGRIPYGRTRSYIELARRAGRPRAARAVGNALATKPVPILVPCHRVIRRDGTWNHSAFGGWMKTQLLTLER